MPDVPKPLLRLPRTLAYTTIRCSLAGALACSSQGATVPDASTDAHPAHDSAADVSPSEASTADAPNDAPMSYDSPTACEAGAISLCGSSPPCDGPCPCPSAGAYYCTDQCPAGCEPFA
ncbi:MAG TPA: hypothetical protein VMI75_15040 [Polyangiaceae bacterium]|nr:hypothetical protein [Polyangiaceae bacterium]